MRQVPGPGVAPQLAVVQRVRPQLVEVPKQAGAPRATLCPTRGDPDPRFVADLFSCSSD